MDKIYSAQSALSYVKDYAESFRSRTMEAIHSALMAVENNSIDLGLYLTQSADVCTGNDSSVNYCTSVFSAVDYDGCDYVILKDCGTLDICDLGMDELYNLSVAIQDKLCNII